MKFICGSMSYEWNTQNYSRYGRGFGGALPNLFDDDNLPYHMKNKGKQPRKIRINLQIKRLPFGF